MLAASAGLVIASPAWAGDPESTRPNLPPPGQVDPNPEMPLDPGSISGQDFAGIRLPLNAVNGSLSIRGSRVWTWVQPSETGPVNRVFVTGDVRIVIGLYEFSAAQAALWIQKLDEPGDAENTYQVFCYFDRVGTPTADASISVSADRLPVRAVVTAKDGVLVKCTTDPSRDRPNNSFVGEAERALARSLRDLYPEGRQYNRELARREDPNLRLRDELAKIRRERQASADNPIVPGLAKPYEPESGRTAARGDLDRLLSRLPENDEARPIFAREGLITLAPGKITVVSGKEENALVISEGLTVQYADQRSGRVLQMSAQRAVVFLPPGQLADMARLQASQVRGIYLEGDVVASDGRYTLRGPRVFYSVQENRAVVLDAVFWTYDQARRLPLYLRAKVIHQQSDSEFTATKATLANTAFFEPDLSIGVSSLTIKRVAADTSVATAGTGSGSGSGDGPASGPGTGIGSGGNGNPNAKGSTIVDAKDITFQAGTLPFFYFPRYKGDPTDVPLTDVRLENSSESGTTIKTTWNAASLFGFEPISGLSTELYADAYFRRGPGLGGRVDFNPNGPFGDGTGHIFAYTVIDDHGEDLLKPGTKREWDGSTRGIFEASGIWTLDEHWKWTAEVSYIGDETFIDQFFESAGETRREFTTRSTLARTEDNTYFKLDTQTNLNDFIANEYLQQTPGYNVDRLPEASYYRLNEDLLSDYRPGLLTYSSEYRIGRLAMNFDKVQAKERGFDTDSLSYTAFGIAPNQSIADLLRQEGYMEDAVTRFDSRHEFSSQLSAGPVTIVPFAVVRGTFWDNDFPKYSPEESQNSRLWGSTGVRFATTIQKVDDSIDSRLLDLHRIRHIIEPNATVWVAGTNVDRIDLPEYDSNVEGIAEGTQGRFAIDQTWQTQRGGPGRWHYVDVFKLNSGVTLASDDADRRSPITHFIDYRPEYSYVGNAFDTEGSWQVSDTYALTGSMQHDLDNNSPQRSSVGVIIQHDPDYSSFIELRHLNAEDSTLADAGMFYRMSSKYEIGSTLTYDLNEGGFQGFNVEVRRQFSSVLMGVNVSYNDITSETGIGFVFQPLGVKGQSRVSGLGTSRGSAGRSGRFGG